jgi:hypothetical protein
VNCHRSAAIPTAGPDVSLHELGSVQGVRRGCAVLFGKGSLDRCCWRPVPGFAAFAGVFLGRVEPTPRPRRKQRNPMKVITQKPMSKFISKDGLIEIVTTTTPRRWPPHQYPVVVVRLRARRGTRVLLRPDGSLEWMPRWSELLSLISQIGLKVSVFPSDKPEERRLRFAKINALRHRRSCR